MAVVVYRNFKRVGCDGACGIEHGDVFHRGGDDSATGRCAAQRQIVRLGTARCEDDLLRCAAQRRSDGLASVVDSVADALPGFEVLTWQGIVAPAGTPVEIINRLNAELIKALKDPEFESRLRGMGLELYGTTPGEFAKLIRDDNAKWAKVIKATGADID